MYVVLKYLFLPAFMLVFRPKVYNPQKMKVKGPAIFVCNHLSMLDPVTIAFLSRRFVHFMAKKEIFATKVGSFFFKALLVFPVKRHTADIASLRQAIALLEKGRVFGIFPEGKRSVTGEIDELEKGAAFIALKSGAPVIPLFIHPDSYNSLRIRLIVGDPISREGLNELSRNEMNDEFTMRIEKAFESLRKELEGKRCGL